VCVLLGKSTVYARYYYRAVVNWNLNRLSSARACIDEHDVYSAVVNCFLPHILPSAE